MTRSQLAVSLTSYTAPCRLTPNEAVSLEHLKNLGVLYWKLKGEEDPKLAAIREARGYTYKVDIAHISGNSNI